MPHEEHALLIPAKDIQRVVVSEHHGPLELRLLEVAALLKQAGKKRPVICRVWYPDEECGGLAIACRRETMWTWLAWALAAPLTWIREG